ncbi:MAG: hypothetical protein J0M18_02170 [Ignavibacteria bacterium]|nr:hypothetical protein [Ignavibacteria bacterium]
MNKQIINTLKFFKDYLFPVITLAIGIFISCYQVIIANKQSDYNQKLDSLKNNTTAIEITKYYVDMLSDSNKAKSKMAAYSLFKLGDITGTMKDLCLNLLLSADASVDDVIYTVAKCDTTFYRLLEKKCNDFNEASKKFALSNEGNFKKLTEYEKRLQRFFFSKSNADIGKCYIGSIDKGKDSMTECLIKNVTTFKEISVGDIYESNTNIFLRNKDFIPKYYRDKILIGAKIGLIPEKAKFKIVGMKSYTTWDKKFDRIWVDVELIRENEDDIISRNISDHEEIFLSK